MDRESENKTGLIYANARYLDPDTGRFLSFDPFEGYDEKPISLHRYLYAYQNPVVYIDANGMEATPYFNTPIDDTTLQIPLFQTIDTGNQVADDALAALASIPNFAFSLANAVPAGLNAPLKVASEISGVSQDEISDTAFAHAMSTGPAAPFMLAGEAPMLPAMALNRLKRLGKVTQTVESTNGQTASKQVIVSDDAPNVALEEVSNKVDLGPRPGSDAASHAKLKEQYHSLDTGLHQKAASKGYPGIKVTENGNPDFSSSNYLYETSTDRNIVTIELQGSRYQDFKAANEIAGFSGAKAPSGYTWHHLDDFDPQTGTSTMQLIQQGAHKASYTHYGSVKQYEQYHGVKYK